jgi:phosphoribosylanthranilate isomerase
MGVFVKICGLCSERDAQWAAEQGADALGFVFWPDSLRVVKPKDVGRWLLSLPRTLLRVGVFVNEDASRVQRVMDEAGLDIAQLHGQESAAYAHALGRRTWKVVHASRSLPDALEAYSSEAFLVDTFVAGKPGGTGVLVEKEIARAYIAKCPGKVILAGGLTPRNVRGLIEDVQPWGVDVSSGVETEVRVKSPEKVREFIQACRRND